MESTGFAHARGRGRGRWLKKVTEASTTDEGPQKMPEELEMSLDDYIQSMKSNASKKEGGPSESSNDIYKSLDTIIKERKIQKPPEVEKKTGKTGLTFCVDNISEVNQGEGPANIGKTLGKAKTAGFEEVELDLIIEKEKGKGMKREAFRVDSGSRTSLAAIAEEEVDTDNDTHSRPSTSCSGIKKRGRGIPLYEGWEPYNQRMGKGLEGLQGSAGIKKKKVDFKPLEFVMTPYRAVSFLSNQGMIIETMQGKMANEDSDLYEARKWRVFVSCGDTQGMCDSARKVVAREMACKEFLDNLKKQFPHVKIPKYVIPEEIFIDPAIYKLLDEEVTDQGIPMNYQFRMNKVDQPDKKRKSSDYEYQSEYIFEDQTCISNSPYAQYAKLGAAAKAWEHVTGLPLPPTEYVIGIECDQSEEYNLTDSEVYQILGREEQECEEVDPTQETMDVEDDAELVFI